MYLLSHTVISCLWQCAIANGLFYIFDLQMTSTAHTLRNQSPEPQLLHNADRPEMNAH